MKKQINDLLAKMQNGKNCIGGNNKPSIGFICC